MLIVLADVVLSTFLRREEYYAKRGLGCYMFALDDGRVIDATTRGNVARYINHSCGGGSGNVQVNPVTGKMEASGKGVRAIAHSPPLLTLPFDTISIDYFAVLVC